MIMNCWTKEWPKEPGLYLYYGGFKDNLPQMQLCTVSLNNKKLHYMTEARFLYPQDQEGAFRPFDEKPPDLSKL